MKHGFMDCLPENDWKCVHGLFLLNKTDDLKLFKTLLIIVKLIYMHFTTVYYSNTK